MLQPAEFQFTLHWGAPDSVNKNFNKRLASKLKTKISPETKEPNQQTVEFPSSRVTLIAITFPDSGVPIFLRDTDSHHFSITAVNTKISSLCHVTNCSQHPALTLPILTHPNNRPVSILTTAGQCLYDTLPNNFLDFLFLLNHQLISFPVPPGGPSWPKSCRFRMKTFVTLPVCWFRLLLD